MSDALRRQGEAVSCGDDGIANFERIRYRHNDDSVFLYAFDLIELDGDDLRREPHAHRVTVFRPGWRPTQTPVPNSPALAARTDSTPTLSLPE